MRYTVKNGRVIGIWHLGKEWLAGRACAHAVRCVRVINNDDLSWTPWLQVCMEVRSDGCVEARKGRDAVNAWWYRNATGEDRRKSAAPGGHVVAPWGDAPGKWSGSGKSARRSSTKWNSRLSGEDRWPPAAAAARSRSTDRTCQSRPPARSLAVPQQETTGCASLASNRHISIRSLSIVSPAGCLCPLRARGSTRHSRLHSARWHGPSPSPSPTGRAKHRDRETERERESHRERGGREIVEVMRTERQETWEERGNREIERRVVGDRENLIFSKAVDFASWPPSAGCAVARRLSSTSPSNPTNSSRSSAGLPDRLSSSLADQAFWVLPQRNWIELTSGRGVEWSGVEWSRVE